MQEIVQNSQHFKNVVLIVLVVQSITFYTQQSNTWGGLDIYILTYLMLPPIKHICFN